MKKIIIFGILGIIFVIIWLGLIDVVGMLSYFKNINVCLLIPTVFFVFLAILLRAVRWHVISKRLIPHFKFFDAIRYYLIGAFVDFLIPIRIGELIKSYKVKKTYEEPISKTVSTIFIDRLMDAFPIIFIVILLPFIDYQFSKTINLLITAIAFLLCLGGITLILFIVYPDFISKVVLKLFAKTKFQDRISYLVNNFLLSLREIKFNTKLFSKIAFLSISAILSNCIAFWFILKAFGDHTITMPIAFFGYALLFLSYIIPAPPALIGSNELVSVLIFSGIFGFNKEFISAITLFFHSLMTLVMITIGVSLIIHYHIDLKEFIQKKQKKEIETHS